MPATVSSIKIIKTIVKACIMNPKRLTFQTVVLKLGIEAVTVQQQIIQDGLVPTQVTSSKVEVAPISQLHRNHR